MKKYSVFIAGTIFLVAFLSVTAFKPLPAGPSANGQGGIDYGGGLKIQHFSFHANTDNSGNVSGSFELKSPDQNIRVHGTIFCLRIYNDGKTAFLKGIITELNGSFPGLDVGDPMFFWVRDNGEGANAQTDQFSDAFISGNNNCPSPPQPEVLGFSMLNISNGNIQVKP